MVMKTAIRTTRFLCLALLFAGTVSGCAFGDFGGVTVKSRSVKSTGSDGKGSNRYLAFRARKKAKDGFGFIRVRRDLWAPFRLEVTGGLFHSGRANLGTGVFYVELEAGIFDPFPFYNICAELVPGGIKLTAHQGDALGDPVTVGELTLDGATVVDFVLDHDGQDLDFLARAAGEATYRTLASIRLADQTTPLRPRFGVEGIRRGAEVGFDD